MATNTSYLGLTKPAQSDLYNVDVFNDNADKVDANAQKTGANLATIEAVATASKPYAVGEYLVLNGILYKVTQAIANGGALVVGTNIAQDSVGTELKSLKDALSNSLVFVQNAKCVEFLVSSNNWCSIRIYTDYTHQNGYSIDLADTGSFSLFKWANGTATKMWQK